MEKHARMKTVFLVLLISSVVLISISRGVEESFSAVADVDVPVEGGSIDARIFKPKMGAKPYVLVLIPASLEPHKMMSPIAYQATHMGIPAAILSLPGSSRTTIEYVVSWPADSVARLKIKNLFSEAIGLYGDAIDEIKRRVGADKVVLMGSGIGAVIASALALQREDVQGLIISHPTDVLVENSTRFNSTAPRNLLFLYGEFDESFYLEYAREIMRNAGVSNPKVNDFSYATDERFSNGTARLIYRVRGAGSVLEYMAYDTLYIVSWWLAKIADAAIVSPALEVLRTFLFMCGLALFVASIPFLPATLSGIFGMFSGGRRWPKIEIQRGAVLILIAWTILLTIVELLAFGAMLFLYVALRRAGLGIEFHAYSFIIVAYSIGIMIISPYFLRKYMRAGMRSVRALILEEVLSDPRGLLLGLSEGIFVLLLGLAILDELFVSIIPLESVLVLFIITYPIHFLGALIYEALFRRVIQEAFGGATLGATMKTAVMSVTLRNIAPILMFLAFVASGYRTFPAILLTFLLLIMLAVEFLPAFTYYTTREILPGVVANTITWYYFVYLLSIRIVV